MQTQELMLSKKEAKLVKKLLVAIENNELWDFSMEFPRESSPVNVYVDDEKTLMVERSDYGGVFAHESYASLEAFKSTYE